MSAGQSHQFDSFQRGRLWSLWDMLKLNAESFYRAAAGINIANGVIQGLKHASEDFGDDFKMTDLETRGRIGIAMVRLLEELSILGAPVTKKAVLRLIDELKDTQQGIGYSHFVDEVQNINSRLLDELSSVTALILQPNEQELFVPTAPLFGGDFAAKFRSQGEYELDEAAKCLALGRSTAGVFHLMRILEIGIRAMARCLQIPDPLKPSERNWAIILSKIWEDGIEKRWPTATDRMVGDGALFESLHASLDAVKNPWRNSTMHVETKYTDDEALHIPCCCARVYEEAFFPDG